MRALLLPLLLLQLLCHAQDSLNVRCLYRWHVDTLPASFLYGNTYNSVWGYTRDGREYGIIGSTMGTHIIDVTDAVNSLEVAFIPGAVQGGAVVHREYKTFRDRLYAVTDEGAGTFQIIDLRFLPDSAPVNYDSFSLFHRAHTLWIDTANTLLYTWAGNSQAALYDLSDPDVPVEVNDCENDVPWWDATINFVHDGYVRDNIAYTNDIDAMHIVDFSDPSSPVLIGSLTNYPQQGYNHSGWLHDNGWLYVMADETHGTDLKLFDVSDPNDITLIDTIGVEWFPNSIAHNPCFDGDLLHVSYYYDGYWLWYVNDPHNATVLGYYDTSLEPHGNSYKGAWGVYPFLPSGHVLVSDMQRGLFVLDIAAAVAMQEATAVYRSPLLLWPSPTEGTFHVQLTDASARMGRLEWTDPQGRTLGQLNMEGSYGPWTIDLGDAADGIYLVRSVSKEGTWTKSIIKASGQ